MARILLVEDEADLREVVAFQLRGDGHSVTEAGTIREALELLQAAPPELVVLDQMLPDQPGSELLRRLRADPRLATIPVILLTARGDEIDRVVAFELGAADYVTKPASMRELKLRVRAVLRRGVGAPEGAPPLRVSERLVIDRERHRVLVDGAEVALTALEFRLLATLVERRGRVQTRERLLQDVWEVSPEVTTRTVDTHVRRLRDKLGALADHVETVRGVGYRFADPGGAG